MLCFPLFGMVTSVCTKKQKRSPETTLFFIEIHQGRLLADGSWPRAGKPSRLGKQGGYTVDGYVFSDQNPYPTYGGSQLETVVPDDCFFVLHDLREDMGDSRTMGVVKKDQVMGKLIFLFRRRGF